MWEGLVHAQVYSLYIFMAGILNVRELVNALEELSLSIQQTREVAFHLGVDLPVLDGIDEEYRGNIRAHYYMQAWLNNDPRASWEKVIDVLSRRNLNTQAEQLTRRLQQQPTCETDGPNGRIINTRRCIYYIWDR